VPGARTNHEEGRYAVVPEYAVYLAALCCEERFDRHALSDTSPEPDGAVQPLADRFDWLRAGISSDLRRLADRLDPVRHPRPYVVEKA
jgi:hypothetical protein